MVPLDRRHADLFALFVFLAELFPLKPLEERRLARCAVAPGVERSMVDSQCRDEQYISLTKKL